MNIYKTITLTSTLILLSWSSQAANTSTGWYKVDDVKKIFKLVDPKCIDSADNKCTRIRYWRVYYKATSQYSPVQEFNKIMYENTPQIGGVMQMTVDVPNKKAAK